MCVNFEDEILLRGENVKPEKNSIFMKNGKTIISIENQKFSKSRMMKWTASLNSSSEI